jgi:hypothetical protein
MGRGGGRRTGARGAGGTGAGPAIGPGARGRSSPIRGARRQPWRGRGGGGCRRQWRGYRRTRAASLRKRSRTYRNRPGAPAAAEWVGGEGGRDEVSDEGFVGGESSVGCGWGKENWRRLLLGPRSSVRQQWQSGQRAVLSCAWSVKLGLVQRWGSAITLHGACGLGARFSMSSGKQSDERARHCARGKARTWFPLKCSLLWALGHK